MNINEQMRELATVGGGGYSPSADTITALLGRTRRARVARQSTATIAGTMGALALGVVAAQAYSAAKDDPAFRDRNIINKDGRSPIELYHAKYGQDNPTRSLQSTVDLTSIIDKLKASAAASTVQPALQPAGPPQNKPATVAPPATTKPVAPPATTKPTPPPTDTKTCEQKYPSYEGATYDCKAGQWVVADGYFMFGNGHVYKAIQWTDAATGLKAWGNWSGNKWGWENKAIQAQTGEKYYSDYVYMGGNASWSASTCTGKSITKWNAKMQASCMTESQVAATGKSYQSKDGIAWVLVDTYKKWFDCTGQYEDPANPPAGYMWNGSAWVEVPPVVPSSPPASPTPSL